MSTFKGKVGLVSTIIVILLTVVMYVLIVLPWSSKVRKAAEADAVRASKLVAKSQRLFAHDLIALAKQAARHHDMINAVQTDGTSAQREAVFKAITDFDDKLRAQKRKAHFFAVVDDKGKVIARDLNIQDMHGEELPYISVKQALRGRATSDVWFMKNMMRGAAAPLIVDDKIVGAVVIAYDFTAAEARRESKLYNAHVAYFFDNSVRASSFFSEAREKGGKVAETSTKLLSGDGAAAKAVASGKIGDTFHVELEEERYVGVAGPLPAPVTHWASVAKGGKPAKTTTAAAKHKVGFFVLTNIDERMAGVTTARWVILGFGLVFLLLVLFAEWIVAKHFVDAEDKLELGVNEMINGNMEYVFDAMGEFEGLANALNVMLARLLGRPEPGEEEEGDQSWRADVMFIDEITSHGGVDIQALAAEADEIYYRRVFQEYVAARQAAGLSVEGITEESFSQKLRANEAMLKAKHKCHMVRFEVRSAGGKVSLKPIRIG